MPKEYKCSICKYITCKKSSYDNHIKSRKHIFNVNDVDDVINDKNDIGINLSKKDDALSKKDDALSKKDDAILDNLDIKNDGLERITCKYCSKQMSHVNNIKRHENVCKNRKVYEVKKLLKQQEKERLELKLELERTNGELEKKTGELEKKNGELDELKEVQEDYHALLKQIAHSKIGKSVKTINMYYILNNFDEAINYEELMDPPLTDSEIKKLNELEPLSGSIHLIESRCIKDIDVKKRPIHCLDTARNKYLLRTKDKWVVDHRAKHIFAKAASHMYKHYLIDPTDTRYNINQIIENQQRLIQMEGKNGQLKLMNDLNDKVSIKNIKIE